MEHAGFKAQLYIRTPDDTWERVGQVRDIYLGMSADSIDAGHRDTGSWGASLPGGKKGELKFDIVFDFNMHRRAVQIFDVGSIENWRVDWNDGTGEQWELRGGISQFDVASPYKDARTANITVPFAGRPSYLNKFDMQAQGSI